MKRTRETIFNGHPDWHEREGVSGCKEFDGEDLQYDARVKHNKEMQKFWIMQQIQEKREREAAEKAEEQAYAAQTLELNRFRGMLQDNFHQRKTDIGVSAKETNLQLAKEKRDKEAEERKKKLEYERAEAQLLAERGKKQAFP